LLIAFLHLQGAQYDGHHHGKNDDCY
jgi:hypothetical protein